MTNREIIDLLKNGKVKITKYTPYPYRVYFLVNDERYMLGSGFGSLYKEYSLFAKVDRCKRKIIDVLACMYDCIEVMPCLYNGEEFKYRKGCTYSKIDTNNFVEQLIREYKIIEE